MRTTLRIDDDVYEDARAVARRSGRSLGAVISELARQSLRPVGMTTKGGFPVFDVGDDAPPITSEMVSRAMYDE